MKQYVYICRTEPEVMEQLMQYIWCHRLWLQSDMVTTDGRPIQVVDPGRLNTDAGPDFFNAKIAIGGHMWAGNVELHVKASDWHRHGHDGDPAYDNVILHVVDTDDTVITRADGEPLPQLVLRCAPDLNRHYTALVDAAADRSVACACEIADTDPVYLRDWLDALAFGRLNDKCDRIAAYLDRCGGDWDQAAFATIARAFGSGINGDMMERMALGLPLRIVARHRDRPLMTDALVFGQARLLDSAPAGGYADELRREYAFLAAKFGLTPPQGMMWKMARMRPAAFPHRRLAQLSLMLQQSTRLMGRVADLAAAADPCAEVQRWLQLPRDGFWATHYTFAEPTAPAAPAHMSRAMAETVVINAVVPLAYAYGSTHGMGGLADRATALMQSLPPESNSVVEMYTSAGMPCTCASDSQAIIQLRRCYCEQHKCLYCRIGHRALARKARRMPALS